MEGKKGKKMETENGEKNDKAKQIALYVKKIMNNKMDKQGYEIAKDHLGSSFCLSRSNGYLDWENKLK